MLKDRLARVARRVSQDASECNRDMGIAYRMTRPTRRPRRAAAGIAATLALGLLLGGCFSETFQRGYIVPEGALEQIPLGSTQEQVLIVLGTPSTVATVSGEAFYYISQRAERPSVHAAAGDRPARRRGLFRQGPPRGAARRLRHEGRQGVRLRQPHHADRRQGLRLSSTHIVQD